jgi:hypothetical protein
MMIEDTASSPEVQHIFYAFLCLIGQQGVDFEFHVSCPEYWRVWVSLNRN